MLIHHKPENHLSKHFCVSNVGVQQGNLIDLHSIKKRQENSKPLDSQMKKLVKANLDTGKIGTWLSLASEPYQISPNLEDYVLVPVVIMPSDLPNRNGVAFPYKDLTAFNPNPYIKRVSYQTWEGAPTFYEHNNSDYTKAKGVVFSVTMTPIINSVGNLYKVTTLCGFDRNKDLELFSKIATKRLSTYSMGAFVDDYVCNICGTTFEQGGCKHVDINNPQFQIFDTQEGRKLAYYETKGMCGFEVSAVETPAYVSAQNDYLLGQ